MEEIRTSLEIYFAKWQSLLEQVGNRSFFQVQQPTAVAWKTTDRAELLQIMDGLRDQCDQIHLGWVNERWLATMHLKDEAVASGITIVKLMERRPNSEDPVGLDHVDFYADQNAEATSILQFETNVKWTEESNSHNCSWISVWFAGTEAKLRTDTVISPCIKEMHEVEEEILTSLGISNG